MIKKVAHFLLLIAAMVIVSSCAKKNTFTGKPVYKKNGGEKNETLFNKRKVKMEALLIESIKLNNELTKTVVQQQVALANSSKLSVIPHLESTVNSVLKELDELSAQLSQEVTYNNEGLEKIQEIRKQLIDLLAKKIGPTSKIIIENSRIRELKSDLAFETGKYKLKPAGIAEITNQVSEIEKRIVDWEQYLDNNGIKIFEKDSFDIKVTISGYADAQGPTNVEIRKKENLDLSAKRAESVKNEFQSQLSKLIEKHKFKANVVFQGKGEELPPNIEDNGKKNNPNRRICLIVSVVSPSSLLVEK